MYRVVILGFLLCASGFSQSTLTAKVAEIPGKTLMSKILAAWNTGDPAKAAAFYDKNASNVYFDIAPLKYRGWTEYNAGVRQILSTFQNFTLTLHDDVRIHRSGNTAWGTATWSGLGKLKNGNGVSLEGRWTCIWEKKGGDWLIVHEHLSAPWAPESESRHR